MHGIRRRSAAVLVAACAAASFAAQSAAHAADFTLITPEESAAEQARLSVPLELRRTRAAFGPRIEILQPDVNGPVATPVSFRIRFVPESPATIAPGSLKVLYGVFKVDITDRLLKAAKFADNVLEMDGAKIPPGTHRLVLNVRDSADHVGERLVTVVVKE